jgi:uncharacterized membrane protein (UPF0182 family)
VTGRRWLLLSLAVAASALLLAKGAAQVYTDYLWYAALGATDVWRARYGALTVLRAGCATVATLFVFANLYAVRQSVVSLVLPRRIGNLDIGEEVPRRQLTWTAAALSAVLGLALAWSQDDWSGFVAARSGVPFGESDPYFAADLGFYVYWLPFELQLFTWALTMVLIVIGLVVLLYALTPSLRWESGSLYVSGYVRRHLAMLAGVLLLMLAWHHRLGMFTLLGGSGADGAFGYLDHRVRIPADLVLSLVTLGAGLTVLWAGWSGQMRLAFAAITGVLVALVGARAVAPFVVDRAATDRDRERPYVATRAGYTRRAFALDRVQLADSTLAFPTLAEAVPFIPAWDEGAARGTTPIAAGAAFGWAFADSAFTLLAVNDAGNQAVITRLLAAGAAPGGLPARGPEEARAALLIVADSTARPRIVADSAGRVAAPALRSRLSRFAHALSLQDFRVWLGELPGPHPKLVARRSVRSRIEALAPVFVQGDRVAPVWAAGTLFWAVELYAASATYPLSRRILAAGNDRAYFQHAGTALVNAADGRTVIVADSARDPIAATWMRRFPTLFKGPAAFTTAARRQLQPAREAAMVQATALARFGLPGENVDGGKHLPGDTGADSALAADHPPLMVLPGLDAPALIIPLLDRGERVRGLFVATGGPSRRSIWLRLADNGPAWGESLDRLHATDTVGAPQVVRGHVRVVPVAGTVGLVQPRYEWNGGDRPRLTHFAVLDRDTVRTPAQLLDLVPTQTEVRPISAPDFRERVTALYAEMRRALARGDWVAYGRAFNELGAVLSRSRE